MKQKNARMLIQVAYLVVLAIFFVSLQPDAAQTAEEDNLQNQIKSLEVEIKQLRESDEAPEAYRELYELQKKLNAIQSRHDEEKREPRDRINKLSNLPEVRQWNQKISEKSNQLFQLRYSLQDDIQKRGQQLHERRQKELALIAKAEIPHARALGFTPFNYPRLDGSTSTHPLGVILACRLLGVKYRWAGTTPYWGRWYTEEGSINPRDIYPYSALPQPGRMESGGYHTPNQEFRLIGYRPVAEPGSSDSVIEDRLSVMINRMLTTHAGTHGAYENVINGISDIGLVARQPSSDELKLAKEKDVSLDVIPFALDAFVFMVNYKNSVTNLSTDQIRAIYTKKLTNWSEVGGENEQIRAYQRNRNSGSQELMETLVMKDLEMEDDGSPGLIHEGMGGPYIALTHDQRGLGYTVYYYERFMAASPNTQLISVDGVPPSYETIRDRKYPYTTEVYIIMRKGWPTDSMPVKFRDWLLSPEGQSVVRESGYVPLPPISINNQ